MKNILVLAYQISPTRGSEYSVGWNYVMQMSKHCRMTVLYGVSGDHIGDVEEMIEYTKKNKIDNVEFVCVKSGTLINALNLLNKHGILVYTFYYAYHAWHKKLYRVVKELLKREKFDMIHYLNPIGYREPGYLWRFDLPYMWGPVGGTTNINPKLVGSLPFSGKVKLKLRAAMNSWQLKFSRRVRKALSRADLLLAATTENQSNFKREFGVDSIYIAENAIVQMFPLNECKFDSEFVDLVFAGSVDSRKSVATQLKALTLMKDISRVRLHIIGNGSQRADLEQFCRDNNLEDSVIWYGNIERERVFELMNNAHLHLITSVMEGNPTTVWEAMSVGLPTLSLDHCGMHDTVSDECGFLINIESSDQIVNDIAAVLDRCVDNPAILRDKADGVLRCREKYSWAKREEFMLECYDKTIENFNKRKRN